jgi:hypothetical protein
MARPIMVAVFDTLLGEAIRFKRRSRLQAGLRSCVIASDENAERAVDRIKCLQRFVLRGTRCLL